MYLLERLSKLLSKHFTLIHIKGVPGEIVCVFECDNASYWVFIKYPLFTFRLENNIICDALWYVSQVENIELKCEFRQTQRNCKHLQTGSLEQLKRKLLLLPHNEIIITFFSTLWSKWHNEECVIRCQLLQRAAYTAACVNPVKIGLFLATHYRLHVLSHFLASCNHQVVFYETFSSMCFWGKSRQICVCCKRGVESSACVWYIWHVSIKVPAGISHLVSLWPVYNLSLCFNTESVKVNL